MSAYYNEIDHFAAQWLRELIKKGLIADGEVDERSIEDVVPNELNGFTQCHFFAGIGIWAYALRQAGWNDDRPVWTGSCPCQPFSAAGKGNGFADERHLWPHFHWLISQCRPITIIGEQVASKNGKMWFDLVQADLEGDDYTSGGTITTAAGAGAPHIRSRIYWVANSKRHKQPWEEPRFWEIGRMGRKQQSIPWDTDWKSALSKLRMLDDGHTRCVGGTDAFRNAIVAPQAQAFIEAVMEIT